MIFLHLFLIFNKRFIMTPGSTMIPSAPIYAMQAQPSQPQGIINAASTPIYMAGSASNYASTPTTYYTMPPVVVVMQRPPRPLGPKPVLLSQPAPSQVTVTAATPGAVAATATPYSPSSTYNSTNVVFLPGGNYGYGHHGYGHGYGHHGGHQDGRCCSPCHPAADCGRVANLCERAASNCFSGLKSCASCLVRNAGPCASKVVDCGGVCVTNVASAAGSVLSKLGQCPGACCEGCGQLGQCAGNCLGATSEICGKVGDVACKICEVVGDVCEFFSKFPCCH